MKNISQNNIKKYKKIEFVGYDYPYKTGEKTLTNYNIRNINLKHTSSEIIISFKKWDSELAIGMIIFKYENIDTNNKKKCDGYIRSANDEIKCSFDNNDIVEKIKKIDENEIKIIIKSKKYNLLLEKSIIPYYNLEDEYNDVVLGEILKEIPNIKEGLEEYNK